jgi:hypothetical protein
MNDDYFILCADDPQREEEMETERDERGHYKVQYPPNADGESKETQLRASLSRLRDEMRQWAIQAAGASHAVNLTGEHQLASAAYLRGSMAVMTWADQLTSLLSETQKDEQP